MNWWALAAAGVQVVSGLAANDKAKSQAKQNAGLIRMETKETLRRLDRDNIFRLGEAKATYGAAGVLMEGTPGQVVNQMQLEYLRQRRWVERVGEQRARVASKGGGYVGMADVYSGVSSGLYAIGTPNTRVDNSNSKPSNNYLGNK